MERRRLLYEILAFACILVSLASGMTKVRLRGSNNPWEGRVEIFYNGTWSKICSSYYFWSQTDADVVCRELGFFRSRARYRSAPSYYRSANASVPIAWTGVSCTGRESTIFNCSYRSYSRYPHCYDYYNRGVAVKCLNLTRENIMGNCNFEFLDMCNYTQDTQGNDETDWNLQKARYSYYGPSTDHTFMTWNDGYYVMVNDRRARLISPVIKNKGCITFYYYFYGTRYYSSHLKSLKVYVKMANSYPKLIWRLQGTTSNGWGMGQIPLNSSAIQVIFEGEAPKSSSSYFWQNSVCLDDITVSTVPCVIFPEHAKIVLDNQPSGEIRLVGGTNSSGRVEVLYKNQWGRVCGDYDWDIKEANVVCRYLGFKGAEAALKNNVFGKGKGLIVLQRVRCAGFEPSLSQCSHDGWEKVSNCGYSSGDAAVICKTSTDYEVRLNGSSVTPYKGRVEVNVGGIWFGVDEREWDLRDGNVACRELGYAGAYSLHAAGEYRTSIRGFGNLRCRGDESSLQQCNHTMMQYRWYNRDAEVKCLDMRLVGGTTEMEGRVEVQYEGHWGTVCNKNWDKRDADVVCRMLGFDQAKSTNCCPKFGEGTGPIVVDDAQCNGNEVGLSFCRIRGWGLANGCTHVHDAGVSCEYKIVLSKVEIVLKLKENQKKLNNDTLVNDLVDVLNKYCREKDNCGDYISDNKTRISNKDVEVSRFEHDLFYLDRLVVEIGVRANLKNGTTISLSNDVLYKAISQKRTLAGHQVLFIDNQAPPGKFHHAAKQKKSYRTIIIVVVVVIAGLLLISAFVYFLMRRKRRVQRLEGLVPQDHAYTALLSDDQEENETLDVGGLIVPPVEDRGNTEEVVA